MGDVARSVIASAVLIAFTVVASAGIIELLP